MRPKVVLCGNPFGLECPIVSFVASPGKCTARHTHRVWVDTRAMKLWVWERAILKPSQISLVSGWKVLIEDDCCDLWYTLTHWGRVTHICVSKLTITGSDNGLSPGRRQAIIWTNARILSIGHLGTNFNEILIEIQILSFKKMGLKMSSAKWRLFSLGLNVLIQTKADAMPTIDETVFCGV